MLEEAHERVSAERRTRWEAREQKLLGRRTCSRGAQGSWERKRTSRSVLERRTRESAGEAHEPVSDGEAHELGGARESVLEKRTREWALERTRRRSEPRTTRASEPANRREAREARGTSSKAVVLWDDAQREVATPFLFSFIGFV